jgi:hypothetical protein
MLQGQSKLLLDRLEGVRKRGEGSWSARCPAHEDKAPSLSVRETEDGVVLVHCFGGCSAHDVVSAVGLELHDLFPPPETPNPRRRPVIPASVLADRIRLHVTVINIAATDLARGVQLSPQDLGTLIESARALQASMP